MKSIKYDEDYKGAVSKIQNKRKKLPGLCERLKVFLTYHMSRYLMILFKDTEDFKGAIRNVKNCQNLQKRLNTFKMVIFEGDGSLD